MFITVYSLKGGVDAVMKISKKNKKRLDITKKTAALVSFGAFRYYMLIIIGYIVLYPLLYMLSTAVKSDKALLDASFVWLPRYFTAERFTDAFETLNFTSALKRTFSLQVVSALIEVLVCAVIAYGFARFNFKGKKVAMVFLIISLLIPTQLYSLSLSINYRQVDLFGLFGLLNKLTGIDLRLNLFNTNWTFWLPSIFGVGVRSSILIYIYIQFFTGLPFELEDAAYVDGAGPVKTFFSIALPSSSVVIVTATVLSVIWHWNETHLASLCFLSDDWPLSVAIYNIFQTYQQKGIWLGSSPEAPAYVFACCLLFITIPLIFYLILQRKFVKSIDRVGITG